MRLAQNKRAKMRELELSSYDYFLPEGLIASKPVEPKGQAKLLVYDRQKDTIEHLHFSDLCEILPKCAIIFNDTKVIKARIFGAKDSGGKIEMLLNQPLGGCNFSCFIKGSVRAGQNLEFPNSLKAQVLELGGDGSRIVKITQNERELEANELFAILENIGHVPLPPYIKRADNKDDESWYQSIFAKNQGAVAAPTASLHFDEQMLNALKSSHEHAFITLHVGAGTFKGVESENILEHKMHSEHYEISKKASELILGDKKLLAVGTTATRSIEYFVRTGASSGECDLFLHPLNPPKRVDFLLTNFHLPKSTLIMLVASFLGLEKTLELYKKAVEMKYRFYSYGDGMLII